MNSQTIVMCVVALLLGMLLAHMLKDVCGCKTVEGTGADRTCGSEGSSCRKDQTGGLSSSVPCCDEYYCQTGNNSNIGMCTKYTGKTGQCSPPCTNNEDCMFGHCVDN